MTFKSCMKQLRRNQTMLPANLIDLNENLTELQECVTHKKERLKNLSRTAKLWIQYLEYIDLLKLFIRAERTGK